MPGLMVHLLLAKKTKLRNTAMFYLGNIAPDAVSEWKTKDITHFRNLEDREPALLKLKEAVKDDFSLGVLLHLYLDWRWDIEMRDEYIREIGADWFAGYRKEVWLASNYAFHSYEWTREVWDSIDSIPISEYGEIEKASKEDIREVFATNYQWHKENITEESERFTQALVEVFTDRVASEFLKWFAAGFR